MTFPQARRVLFVHAHPDDESITTGATIAAMRAAGATVNVVTATRGEQGEVLVADLKHLEQHRHALGAFRAGELAAACAALDVSQHCYFDDLVGFAVQDSGMRWLADGVAGPAESATATSLVKRMACSQSRTTLIAALARLIADFDADLVITYDPSGGYGHPDHIAVHDAVMAAARSLNVAVDWLLPPDESGGDWCVDGSPWAETKRRALACYRTQVRLDGERFALGHETWWPLNMVERFESVLRP